jgi:uncharacterized phage protein gp47/JayE
VQTDPTPLNDLNVGSVIRTMMETFARELAMTELNLDHVYKSAFLETATRNALDKVVALVGVSRLPAGHPVAKVQFKRKPQSSGQITIPAGTAVTDSSGQRYLTLASLVLEPNESQREVLAGGQGPGTKVVKAGALNRLEILIAGISEVTNPQPARQPSAPESDEDLRIRSKGALHSVVRGTLDALKFGILSVPGVKNVSFKEFPNGVAGEVQVEVAYNEDTPEARAEVSRRIRELKPAGIRIVTHDAAKKIIEVKLELTLAGAGVPDSELAQISSSIEEKVTNYLSDIPPGGTARQAKMSALVLEDNRVVDAKVSLVPDGQESFDSLSLKDGEVIEVKLPFDFLEILTEDQPEATSRNAKVSLFLPVIPEVGITASEAESSLRLAFSSYLTTRSKDALLTIDTLVTTLRDDSRYALIRSETLLTIEVEETFLQLSDQIGEFRPTEFDVLEEGEVNIDVRST